MRQLDGDARLVDEAANEPALARGARQDALERLHLLEARDADGLDLVDLGHPALRDLLEDVVLAETLAQRFHRPTLSRHESSNLLVWPITPSWKPFSATRSWTGRSSSKRCATRAGVTSRPTSSRTTSGSSSSATRCSISSSAIG